MSQIGISFLRQAPVPIKFGTSGLRGLAADLTDLECYINIRGFLDYLKGIGSKEGGIESGAEIYLAGDFRPSTSRIMKAAAKAINDSGCLVKNCGYMPAPAVAYCGLKNNCASIMITGSHIPEDRNGIKPNKANGEVLKDDEEKIFQHVAAAREKIYATLGAPDCFFNEEGMFAADFALPEIDADQKELYIKRYVDVFPADCLKGKKIVVYEHSSAGRDIVAEIFKKLGAEVIIEGRTDEFVSIDTEALKEEDLKLMKEWAEKHKPFALISFDGDCDRPWLSDEHGEFLNGDLLGGLAILHLKADFGAVPVTCSDAVDQILEGKTRLARTKIGSPYVIKSMMDAYGKGFRKIAGWEVNGGFMTYTDLELYNGRLLALPTRDAVLPLLCVILSAIEKDSALSEIISVLPKRFSASGKKTDFPIELAEKIVKKYSPDDGGIKTIKFHPEEIIIIRQDGSEETKEKNSSFWDEWQGLRKTFEKKYFIPNRIGRIASFDYTDGLRIFTENGEIIHFRESNNAPEMRCYAVADSNLRAQNLVKIGLNKILLSLEADLS